MYGPGISVGGNSIGNADGGGKAPQTPAAVEGLDSDELHPRKQGFCGYFAGSGGMFERAWGECLFGGVAEGGGAIGALYFMQRQPLDALIALEICPLVAEYPILDGENPVLLVQDGCGVYDEGLNGELCAAGVRAGVEVQLAAISGFGSDASIAMKFGHVARAACLGFPTQNTQGFEIAHRAGDRQLRSYPQSLL